MIPDSPALSEQQRLAYLRAMGVDVWQQRPAAPLRDRLVVGPVRGTCLLVCEQAEETSSRLAADIERAVEQGCTWAWLDELGQESNPNLPEVIDQHLFTEVILFGNTVAGRLDSGDAKGVIGSARVAVATPLIELSVSGVARQAFWREILSRRLG